KPVLLIDKALVRPPGGHDAATPHPLRLPLGRRHRAPRRPRRGERPVAEPVRGPPARVPPRPRTAERGPRSGEGVGREVAAEPQPLNTKKPTPMLSRREGWAS